ncbi:Velvet domain-containing protein [Mycena kentingensis (nom. inval.)]|nr:Velvet domain-containing protein [Mycena kentingensis (nom. inval.)]
MHCEPRKVGVPSKRVRRRRSGTNPKSFLLHVSLMNSVTKTTRKRLRVQCSKPHIRLRFTKKRRLALYTGRLDASSGKSSPQTQTLSSLGISAAGTTSSGSSSSGNNSTTEYATHRPHRGNAPRLRISSLLADNHSRSYQLHVVQNPVCTAEFRNAILSRLPLSPPIVVSLTVRDSSGNAITPEDELPFLIAHLSLYAENGSTPLDMGSSLPATVGAAPPLPILYGNLVSSLQGLEDQNGTRGLFFVFPDVSIRWRGRYQLQINLVRISRRVRVPSPRIPDGSGLAEQAMALAQARTTTFSVLPYHEYTVPPQTRLTQAFIRQGAQMR